MLTLKDISLKSYIDGGIRDEIRFGEHYTNAILLKRYGVSDCQTLYEFIESGNPEFQKEIFKRIIKRVTDNLKIANTKGLNPKRYTFENYDKYPELKSILERTDSIVLGSDLPVFSPLKRLQTLSQLKDNLYKLSIEDIKQHLGMIGMNARNSISTQTTYMDCQKMDKIAKGIGLYEEQLIRIALDTPNVQDYKGNLFYKDGPEKEKIIEPILEDIMLYLMSASEEFIWGKMGKITKKLLLSSLSLSSDLQIETRTSFLKLIRNYVTLRELEEGIIENGTLKRFIVEPKNKSI